MFDERRPREHRTWALPLFLLVALLVHSLGFYTFHVVYPTPQDIPLATATLSLVTIPETAPDGAESSAQPLLAGWLRDSDPALLATWRARTPDWARLERGKYAPLFERWKLQPELAPLTTPFTEQAAALANGPAVEAWDWRLGQTPLSLDPAWLGSPASGPTAASTADQAAASTQINILPLTGREEAAPALAPAPEQLNIPAFRAAGESLGSVQNAEFLLGTDSTGQVLFTLTRRSSNSADLDEAALRYLRALQLAPPAGVGSSLHWWRARFSWGREVFTRP